MGEVKSQNKLLKIGGQALALVQVLLVLIVFFAVQIACLMILAILDLDYEVYTGSFTFGYAIVMTLVMVGLLKISGVENNRTGFLRTEKLRFGTIPFIIVIALGMLGLVTLFLVLINSLAELGNSFLNKAANDYSEAMDRYANIEPKYVPTFDHYLDLIGSVLLIPIAEELTFRGAIMGGLMRKFKPAAAIILSSIIFGFVHGISIQIAYAFACGIVLGTVYYITDSIVASYLIHAIFNLLGGGVITFMQSSAVNASDKLIDKVDTIFLFGEMMCIVPAFVSLFFLYKIYKKKVLDEQT